MERISHGRIGAFNLYTDNSMCDRRYTGKTKKVQRWNIPLLRHFFEIEVQEIEEIPHQHVLFVHDVNTIVCHPSIVETVKKELNKSKPNNEYQRIKS